MFWTRFISISDHLSLQVEYPLKFAKSDLCGLLKALPNTSDVEEIAREVKKRILCQNSALKIRNVRVFDKESPMSGVKIVIIVQVTVKGISPLRRKQDWINMYLYDNRAWEYSIRWYRRTGWYEKRFGSDQNRYIFGYTSWSKPDFVTLDLPKRRHLLGKKLNLKAVSEDGCFDSHCD